MALLDEITKMKNQGIPEAQIITNLQEKGIAPKAINDALSQLKIKNAIQGEQMNPNQPPQNPQENQGAYNPPATQEAYNSQEAYPQEEYYQEGYEETQQNYSAGIGTETVIEVAEQVFEEKTKEIQKTLNELKEFSSIAGNKISSFDERLKKIETTIENLQIKILEKVSSYGSGIENIKNEMNMMQNSFSKMIPAIVKKQTTNKKPIIKKKIIKKKISKK